MRHYLIYETRNLKNGMTYIGMHQTDNLEDGYLGSGYHLKRAIRYYGKEFFERKILFECNSKEEMIQKEIELVTEEFVARKDTYNLKPGGSGGFNDGEHRKKNLQSFIKAGREKQQELYSSNKEWCDKISKKRKEVWSNYSIDRRNRILDSLNWDGKKHSKDTKTKISESIKGKQSGNKNSQYSTCWITNGKENKKIHRGCDIPNGFKLGRKMNKGK